jgi:hypothetical protein
MFRRGPIGPVTLSGKIVSCYEAIRSACGLPEPGMAADRLLCVPANAGNAT